MGKRKKAPETVPFKGFKPKYVDERVWTAVIEAWENGLSDREAAFRASRETDIQIKASEIQEWKHQNNEIAELCEMLKDDIKALAKTNARTLLKAGDDKMTRWYLEHKCADEFSTKSAVAFEGAVVELSLEEKERALKELVETFGNGR